MGNKYSGPPARYRIALNLKTDLWYCLKVDTKGKEISRSPEGTPLDAEHYETNMRRTGAWKRS